MLLELLLGTSLLAAAGARAAGLHRRRAAERTSAWQALAHGRRGRFIAAGGPLGRAPESVEVMVEQAVVALDTCEGRDAHGSVTRARAALAMGGGPSFRARPRTHLDRARIVLGGARGEDAFGDRSLDDAFVLEHRDGAATRRAFGPRARRLLLGLRCAAAASTGTQIVVTTPGHVRDAARLEMLVDLAGALASYGMDDLAAIAELPDARMIGPSGPWDSSRPPRVEIPTSRGVVRIACLPGRERPKIELSHSHVRGFAPFSVDLEGGRLTREPPRGLFGARAAELLTIVGAGTLSGSEERVRLVFPTAPTLEALRAGVSLLAELAGASCAMGAFR